MGYFPEKFTIAWLRNSYRSKEVTPAEVAEEIIRRADRYREYHIWIQEPSAGLMQNYIENLPQDPSSLPLWGIPFAIKDNIDLEQVPTSAACPDYAYIPRENAAVAERLIRAGAIPVGKTNMDQFATGLVGTRSPYGEVKNAMNPELISGGSSSGSAVAVALGMAAFALGTDTAGSGRVPAALNGLVGYKPSPGAWSVRGVVPACASLDCISVFANTLADAKEIDTQARGYDSLCCWSRKYKQQEASVPTKICLPYNNIAFFGEYADIYEPKWEEAKKRITGLGIPVEFIDYSIFAEAAKVLYEGPWVAERWCDLGGFVEQNPGKIFPVTEKILRGGAKEEYTAAGTFKALHKIQELKRKAKIMLEDTVLVLPTAGGTFTRKEVREKPVETNSMMGLYTNHCNLLELCAAAVPQNVEDKELPFGITMFALAEEESLVWGLAEKFLEEER